jgi:hypothetical protein
MNPACYPKILNVTSKVLFLKKSPRQLHPVAKLCYNIKVDSLSSLETGNSPTARYVSQRLSSRF